MKNFFLLLLLFLLFLNLGYSQIVKKPLESTVCESLNDSLDLANIHQYFVDSLGYYFFSSLTDSLMQESDEIEFVGFELYDEWDSLQIHYPRFDFKTKTDTSYLPLASASAPYFHPVKGVVTSNFGWRRSRFHYGIDLNLNTGDTVYNAFKGVVRVTKRSKSYGNVVVVRHDNGLETLYAHLHQIHVSSGDTISEGQCIGLGGNTGRSRGSHLHFEIRYLGAAICPLEIINFDEYKLVSDTLAISKTTFDYLNKISSAQADSKNAKWVVVRRGDTLSHLASRHRTSVRSIQQINRMKGTMIREGQRLRVR
ncbi:MAG: peptidoglycan DD-metalloendopeptidase family protein [Bacteroidales bacterium]|nr:peptidoglycan DD-metalloendopeptidase family protein [Bacteroidales bacterium]MDY0216483.1 peptidoglycan DD-metalloendopeptidase family protein [Bacteroidales bacterium]